METRFNAASSDATATGTGAWAANFPCSLMLSKSEIGTTLRIARDTGPRAGYHLSMALARINFLARFATLLAVQEHKEERCPAPLGDCASKTRLTDGVRRSDCAVDDRWR